LLEIKCRDLDGSHTDGVDQSLGEPIGDGLANRHSRNAERFGTAAEPFDHLAEPAEFRRGLAAATMRAVGQAGLSPRSTRGSPYVRTVMLVG
jgi:hypothetical protein